MSWLRQEKVWMTDHRHPRMTDLVEMFKTQTERKTKIALTRIRTVA
jgi:hypothetical protein